MRALLLVMRAVLLAVAVLTALPAPSGAVRTRLRRPRHGVQVRLTPFAVPALHEREVCQLVTLSNRRPMDIGEIDVATASGPSFGSHHFAMFLYTGGHPERFPPTPFDAAGCVGGADHNVEPILAFVQRTRDRIRLPAGIAVRIAAHQPLLLNSHFINGGDVPIDPDVVVNLEAAPKKRVRHHARTYTLGTFDIDIPPGTSGTASGTFTAPYPMNLVTVTSHSHKHTTSVTVDLLRGGADAGQVLETVNYADPNLVTFTTPVRLEPGDGLRWTCAYRNDTDRTLHFGVTSNDEMCFTEGFFYPDDDAAPLPPAPGCFPQTDALLCFP